MYNYSITEEQLNILRALVDKYQRNLRGISEEERETRYKKAFSNLKKEIQKTAAMYIYMCLCSVYMPVGSPLYGEAAKMAKKYLPEVMNILMDGGDVEEVVDNIREEFLDNFYFPMMQTAMAS